MTKLNLSVKPAVVAQSPIVVTPIMVVNATKGPAVSIDIDGAAKAYKGLVKQASKNILILKSIGEVLNVIRSEFASNTLFGQHIANDTPLVIMTRQDRNDAMWLAENWLLVQIFKEEKDLSTNSVGVLRKMMSAAKKEQREKTPTDPKDSEDSEGGEGSGEAGTGTVPKTLDIVELTEHVLGLVSANGLTTKALIKALQASLKA